MSATPQTQLPAHGGQLRQIAARYGVQTDILLDFSANINPDGPPLSVLAALQRALADRSFLTVYPDLELTELKRALAHELGVGSEHIAVANGFVPLLEAGIRSAKIARCLVPMPSFSEYRRTLANAAVEVIPYGLSQEGGFFYDPNALLQALLRDGCDAILLANPQNPSGMQCDADELLCLVEMAAQHNVIVLLDEAFVDYTPTQSITRFAAERSNLIVFRSVTKFFAIPGLRVAYAVSKASLIEALNRAIAPWPITSLASEAVCAAVQDEIFAEQSRRENDRRRTWLEQQLTRLEIFTYPSAANFLLLRFAAKVDIDLLWERMIVEEHIVLRTCANFEGISHGHLRIAVRSDTENQRLIHSLERVLVNL